MEKIEIIKKAITESELYSNNQCKVLNLLLDIQLKPSSDGIMGDINDLLAPEINHQKSSQNANSSQFIEDINDRNLLHSLLFSMSFIEVCSPCMTSLFRFFFSFFTRETE